MHVCMQYCDAVKDGTNWAVAGQLIAGLSKHTVNFHLKGFSLFHYFHTISCDTIHTLVRTLADECVYVCAMGITQIMITVVMLMRMCFVVPSTKQPTIHLHTHNQTNSIKCLTSTR